MKPNGIPAIPSPIVALEHTGLRSVHVLARLRDLSCRVASHLPGRTALAAAVVAFGCLSWTSIRGGGQGPQGTVGQTEETARIHGQVTDQTGGVIPGVELTLRNVENNVSRTTLSNDQGSFEFADVLPGKYEFSTEMAGFEVFRKTLSIGPGARLTIHPVLKVDARLVLCPHVAKVERSRQLSHRGTMFSCSLFIDSSAILCS